MIESYEDKLGKFITKHNLSFNIKDIENDSYVYTYPATTKYAVKIRYGVKFRTFHAFSNRNILYNNENVIDVFVFVLRHISEACCSYTMDYWLKECNGDDMLNCMQLEGKERNKFAREYCKYIHGLEVKMVELLGQELFEELMALGE